MSNQRNSKVTINGIVGILFFVLIAFLFVTITGGLIRLLYSWVPLVLFGGALLVNYKTVLRYVKFLVDRFKSNPGSGIIAVLLTVVFYPFVAGFLLAKAFLDRKIAKLGPGGKPQDEFVEYEDLTEDTGLDLKPLSEADPGSRYDDMLEDDSN